MKCSVVYLFVCLFCVCFIWRGTLANSLSIQDDSVDSCVKEPSFESIFDACKASYLNVDGPSDQRYWDEQLEFLVTLNASTGNEECLKWYNYYECLLARTSCGYATLLHMVHLRNPTQGHEFYTAFYERNCDGDHLKPEVEALLSVPATPVNSCLELIAPLEQFSYAEAIDCIREAAENTSLSDEERSGALHIADLITPPWYSPASYFVAGNDDLCTIGLYGDFHVKHCDTARIVMCPWMTSGMMDTVLFQDERLIVKGMLHLGAHRNTMIMMSLLRTIKIEFKNDANETIAKYETIHYSNMPATFTNNKTTAGEGIDKVYLGVRDNIVQLTQPGRGINIVGMSHTNGRSLVLRMPKEVVYRGEMLKTWSNRCNTNHGTALCITKWESYQYFVRNHTLGEYLDQCLHVRSAAMRDVCRSDTLRYLFYSNPAVFTEEWYDETLLAETQDANSQYQTNSSLFPRPRHGTAGPANSVLPFAQVQSRPSPVPCIIPSEDLSMTIKTCYWTSWRTLQPDVYERLTITDLIFHPRHWPLACSDNLFTLMHKCVMEKSLCSSDVVSTLIESETNVSAEGPDSSFRNLICKDGRVMPEAAELLNEPASAIFNLTLTLEQCSATFSRYHYEEALRDRYLSMMFLCATSAIQQSTWPVNQKRLAISIVTLILPPGMTPEETEAMSSPYYDFKLHRCTVGVYGDPHIRTCNRTALVTCSLAGRQVYLLSPFFRIDGINTMVPGSTRRPPPTTLTSFVLSVAALDSPYQFVEIYRAESGVVPLLFRNGDNTWGTTDQDRFMIASRRLNSVQIVQSYLGMVIYLNVVSGDYFFSLRVAEAVISPSVGLLSTGCSPAYQIIDRTQVIGRRRRAVGGDGLSEAKVLCAAVEDDRDFRDACVYDVTMTGNSKFVDMAKQGLENSRAIEWVDTQMIGAAKDFKIDTITVDDVIIEQERCRSLLLVQFNGGVVDTSGERSWIDNKGVEAVTHDGAVDGHAGNFHDDGYFRIDRFSYGYFGTTFRASVRFLCNGSDDVDMDQVLISNGEQGVASIELLYNPDQELVTASLQTIAAHGRLTIHANASMDWVTIDYRYNGEVFMIRASANNALLDQQYIHLNGAVKTVASSLYIGGLETPPTGHAYFKGFMDSVELDVCGGL